MDINRILDKLDSYFAKNDYSGAERHLKYWLDEADSLGDLRSSLSLCNELIGLSRKIGNKEASLSYCERAVSIIASLGMEDSVSAATTYVNIATAHKAFGKAEESLPFFERACTIYERDLPSDDSRLGGLYNNMALTFCDLSLFDMTYACYDKALTVMSSVPRGELEQAITHLNIASALEQEKGLLEAESEICERLDKASALLDIYAEDTDGYYAFVCEKCATVFGYYGYFFYEKELKERAARIYERD